MSIYYALSLVLCANAIAAGHVQQPFTQHQTIKVPIELGVMSRCPDAIACEAVFDQVRLKVGDKMDLSLVYVAHVQVSTRQNPISVLHACMDQGNAQEMSNNYKQRGHGVDDFVKQINEEFKRLNFERPT
ncbi:hypothetical protein MIND_00732000 [Mycena indigotica]|uniref:Uncharacterized protein n=1 Tax=Mycena indigotica TaxID=2126181 RepID=A0A8H6SMN2_9AGAR|nr:uncharacterized protein MIND_00732000 [Mycena indigotica]KAF7301665.1 hypothetical protein MIND_00732000 [Mycena indigotica]